MSRVGKSVIKLPEDIKINIFRNNIRIQGKLGILDYNFREFILVDHISDKNILSISTKSNLVKERIARSLWGTTQRNILNMIYGVSNGFKINLELNGVGYKAQLRDNKKLILNLGFSHEIEYEIPEDINIFCEKPTAISVLGVSKQRVGQVASEIRSFKKPEPYKGKGIIKQGEFIRRKEGKKK